MHVGSLTRAKDFCREAGRRLTDQDWDRFAVAASIGVELLLKARLAKIHPTLIIQADSFDSLLHVCTAHDPKTPPKWDLRTIGAYDALDRYAKVNPSFRDHVKNLKTLTEARNGIVHLGIADSKTTTALANTFFKAVDQVASELGESMDSIFETYARQAKLGLQEAQDSLERDVVSRIDRARQAFSDFFGRLERGQREAVLAASLSRPRLSFGPEARTQCPACENMGVATGEANTSPEIVRQLADGRLEVEINPYVEVFGFECLVCPLRLDTQEEVVLAKIPIELGLPQEGGIMEPPDSDSAFGPEP